MTLSIVKDHLVIRHGWVMYIRIVRNFQAPQHWKVIKAQKVMLDTLKNSLKKEENYKMTNINQHKFSFLPKKNEYRRNAITRRTPLMR